MRILYKTNTLIFGDLKIGDVFIDTEVDNVWMKVDETIRLDSKEPEHVNAISLQSGSSYLFSDTEVVMVVDAELNIVK